MKHLLILGLSFWMLCACTQAPQKTDEGSAAAGAAADSVAITQAIHGFYQWYLEGKFGANATLPFIVNNGGKQSLDAQKLEAWGSALKKSGFVSEEYLTNVKAYFKKCEPIWANENTAEGPSSCLDADLFTCYQDSPDLLIDAFTKNPFKISLQEGGRAVASSEEIGLFPISLKAENGKWLLTNFGCVAVPAE